MRVRLGPEFNRTTAKHLRTRLQLHVHFETYGGDVVDFRFQISDFKFDEADLRDATKMATNSLASLSSGWTRFTGISFASTIICGD
jgi:hypothetical protein